MTFKFEEHEVFEQTYPTIRKNDSGMIVLFVNDHKAVVLKSSNGLHRKGDFVSGISIDYFPTLVHGTLTF